MDKKDIEKLNQLALETQELYGKYKRKSIEMEDFQYKIWEKKCAIGNILFRKETIANQCSYIKILKNLGRRACDTGIVFLVLDISCYSKSNIMGYDEIKTISIHEIEFLNLLKFTSIEMPFSNINFEEIQKYLEDTTKKVSLIGEK